MSHVTKVNLKVRDLDALETACDRLGLELQRGKTTYAWWGSFVGDSTPPRGRDPQQYGHNAAHSIRVKGTTPRNGHDGPWEIGVLPALDGDGFDLMCDEYGSAGRALTSRMGPGASTLRKEYAFSTAEAKAKRTLGRKGWTTARVDLPTGGIKLKLRKR